MTGWWRVMVSKRTIQRRIKRHDTRTGENNAKYAADSGITKQDLIEISTLGLSLRGAASIHFGVFQTSLITK